MLKSQLLENDTPGGGVLRSELDGYAAGADDYHDLRTKIHLCPALGDRGPFRRKVELFVKFHKKAVFVWSNCPRSSPVNRSASLPVGSQVARKSRGTQGYFVNRRFGRVVEPSNLEAMLGQLVEDEVCALRSERPPASISFCTHAPRLSGFGLGIESISVEEKETCPISHSNQFHQA